MTSDPKPVASDWQRMWFKENKVWMAMDSKGMPISKDNKVLIKYQIKQDYEDLVKEQKSKAKGSKKEKSCRWDTLG